MDLRRRADCAGRVVDAAPLVAPRVEQVDGRLEEEARHEAEPPVRPMLVLAISAKPHVPPRRHEERHERRRVAPGAEEEEPGPDLFARGHGPATPA